MINVTKTYLPPQEEIEAHLKQVFDNNIVTNNGPKLRELEKQLCSYLNTEHLELVTNGTIALQLALKSLDITGKVLTTPMSYVATLNAIVWENCEPVFVDVDPDTGNVDSSIIAQLDMSDINAMLFTHVFGNPCDVNEIEEVSNKWGIPVIYDAAHAFGVLFDGVPLINYGTMSTLSFHATKIFHTVEGGAIICSNKKDKEMVGGLKSFGHKAYDHFACGINGKMSEVHAVFGLCMLNHMERISEARKKIHDQYTEALQLKSVKIIKWHENATRNYSYFPILFNSEDELLEVMTKMADCDIVPRRYFYPSLNKMPYIDYQACPISESFSKRVMCLPLYFGLEQDSIKKICDLIP